MNTNEMLYKIITREHEYGMAANGLIEELDEEMPYSERLPVIIALRSIERRMAAVMSQQATAREIAERIAAARTPGLTPVLEN